MFEASHPFAFFDYFRVPYEVRPPQDADGHLGAPASVGRLRAGAASWSPGALIVLAARGYRPG